MELPPSSSSRTMRWATAKTARPISRSSSCVAARRSRSCCAAARRRQRGGGGVPLRYATAPRARRAGPLAPAAADPGPKKYAARVGSCSRRLVLADAPGGKPEVILIATGSECQPCPDAHEKLRRRGYSLARRLDAVLGALRSPDTGIPGQRAAASVKARVAIEQASTFGWERYVGIGAHHRHENVRGLRAPQGAPEELRLRAGTGGRGRKGNARQELTRVPGISLRFLDDPRAQTLARGAFGRSFSPGPRDAGSRACAIAGSRFSGASRTSRRRPQRVDGRVPLLHPWANRLAGLVTAPR